MPSVQERRRTGQQTTTLTDSTALARAGLPPVIAPFVQQWNLDRTKVDLIKRTVCPRGTTDDQMALFFHECARRGVHPMDRLLIMTLFRDDEGDDSGDTTNADGKKPVFITTIDLFRAQAQDTGTYGGADEPKYGPDMPFAAITYKGKGRERTQTSKSITVPQWASVTAYKLNGRVKVPFVGKARWSEFYPGPSRGHLWHKMPYNQLAKCAEAQALRKAFPRKLGRLYVREEMEQAGIVADATPAGTGRTPAAERAAAADPMPDPPAPDVDDITDAEELPTPPIDRWQVIELVAGKKRGKDEPIWKLVAENGERVRDDFYTDQKAIAETLEQFKKAARIFTIAAERRGQHHNIIEIAALP